MEDTELVRCASLDSGSSRGREVTAPLDHITFDPVGFDAAANPEPSPAEVAQCEAEVATLLSIIADLNKKMGALKAPSDPGDLKPRGPSRPVVPDLLSHRLVSSGPERKTASAATSKPPGTKRGGSGATWSKLQEVLSAVEDSISCRRSWAIPITASDREKQTEHLVAAHETWVKATQILEEMEREFGISCPKDLPNEERQQNQRDILDLDLHRHRDRRRSSQSHRRELDGAQSGGEEKSRQQEKPVSLHKAWRSGSLSPSYSPSASATGGALSPGWASSPFPGSPLILRRATRALPPLSAGGDPFPFPSAPSSSGSASGGSPCSSPVGLESETERLNTCIERLKAKNERLTAALERRKGESEQISLALSRYEADCSALQMALRYCEECEDAYSELLSLYEAKKQQGAPLRTDSAEPDADRLQPGSPAAQLRNLGAEELSTSFSAAGGTEEIEPQSHTGQRPSEMVEREAALHQQIERLKKDRAAICLPKRGPRGEAKLSPDTGNVPGTRGGHGAADNDSPPDSKKEKAALLFQLISVRRLCENAAKLGADGDVPGPRSKATLRELQAVLHREQALKKRLALVRESMNTCLPDSASHRRQSKEQIARLMQAHSKAVGLYRNARRKYREQVWRLEQKVAAGSERESQQSQIEALKATLEAMEPKREETVL
ncbi:uncharacterized protein ushbp1 isoform X2 [Myripristis murdjan]|uniref:uncharacterized protein ushbp1 isoform X2 n=1 Tax=Myripristis murdjan TaxID=586833 RepID=UPI001175ECF0|nr:colorectal mutant cancer protein isoform X2 [Myripristis murdjan]